MFSNTFKDLFTKPTFINPLFKSTLLSSKTPFQAALLKRSFARQAPQRPSTSDSTSFNSQHDAINSQQDSVQQGPNVDQIIRGDPGLNSFMSKIYKTTGLSISGSLGLSYLLAATSATVVMSPLTTMLGGLAMSICGILAFESIQPKISVEQVGDKTIEKWTNPRSRQLAFSTVIASSGIMISPLIAGLSAINPGIIPMAAGLSLFTMGGASLYAMYKPLGQFKTWESTLSSTLMGIIGMNVLSLIVWAAIGPNIFSLACRNVDLYAGLGLFAAYQAFDTQAAVQAYKEGNYDHLMHVVDFFLNFKNMLVRFASILGDSRAGSSSSQTDYSQGDGDGYGDGGGYGYGGGDGGGCGGGDGGGGGDG